MITLFVGQALMNQTLHDSNFMIVDIAISHHHHYHYFSPHNAGIQSNNMLHYPINHLLHIKIPAKTNDTRPDGPRWPRAGGRIWGAH